MDQTYSEVVYSVGSRKKRNEVIYTKLRKEKALVLWIKKREMGGEDHVRGNIWE